MERDGYVGLGSNAPHSWVVGNPLIRCHPDGQLSFLPSLLCFGNTNGPWNASALITAVSNVDEWLTGETEYPSGKNHYYFGTRLTGNFSGAKRAPLIIGARELHFMTGPNDVLGIKIAENTNVMIGADIDNGDKLQVTGNASFTGNVTVSGNTIKFAGLSGNNSVTRILAADVNGNLFFRDASTLALNETMNSDLAINGSVSAQKMLITQTGRWPDYVFSKQYTLPSLSEVENFIKQNNHLPGIPSAAEVEKKGIDVGDNQAALLKKIEELTLYVIEQNKKQQQHSEEIAELRKQVKILSQKK
jgi:hypothetical protein